MNAPEPLIQTLCSSPNWRERREAALALGRHKTRDARLALIDALNDQDEDVVHAALLALGNVGDEEAVDHMILPRYLNHPNFQIRWATLKTIGRIGQFCRIPDIADMTNDSEWIVRNEALKLIRQQTESILEHCSPESARRLTGLLVDSNEELHAVIVEALQQVGPHLRPFLREVLKTGGGRAKKALALIMGRLQDRESIPLLLNLLQSPEKEIRQNAVEALGRIGDVSSLPGLIEMFGDPNRGIQVCAASAIAKIGRAAVPALHEKLHYSSRKTIHRNILYTLALIRDPSSIPYLIEHLGSTYFIVRRAAINGLVQYESKAIEGLRDVIRNIKLPMVDDLLLQAEKGGTIPIRVRAIRALGALADHRAVHLLKRLAAGADPAIQKSSLDSLAQIGCSCWQRCGAMAVFRELRIAPDVELIIEQLEDDSENVRLRAIQVLARGGRREALPALLRAVAGDPNENLRYEALRGADELAPADPSVLEAARYALGSSSSSSYLLAEAARVLGRTPEERNIPLLIDCLKNISWKVRRNAALALGNMGEMALPALIERLSSSDELELESVVRAIGNVGALSAVSVLEDMLIKHPEDSLAYCAARKAILDIRGKAA